MNIYLMNRASFIIFKCQGKYKLTSRSFQGFSSRLFLVIRNKRHPADYLVSAQTPVAAAVEIHQTIMEGAIAKMRRVEGGLEVPSDGELALEHGSYHIMLIDLQQDLEAGDYIDLTLNLEHSGSVMVEVEIRAP